MDSTMSNSTKFIHLGNIYSECILGILFSFTYLLTKMFRSVAPTVDTNECICLPGQRLCRADSNIIHGVGTYELSGYIHASKSGIVNIEDTGDKSNLKIINVHKPGSLVIIPNQGDVVTARVLITNPRFAKCAIFTVGSQILENTYRGLLRKEDVRETEKDRVDIYKSFKPGDIILARVINQLDQSFVLSTAENELGVVVAYSIDTRHERIPMIPLGWDEMQCPKTLNKEPRKVAKVAPESAFQVPET